ncbi:MAG: hypothetical protein QHC90_08865 [Shinella sp.]|nr:hypothetical protein [Shinella sp.]
MNLPVSIAYRSDDPPGPATGRTVPAGSRTETFDFLGFTHICGKTRRGEFQLLRKSRRDRMRAKLQEVKDRLRWLRNRPIREQAKWLRQVIRGYYEYHAVPANMRSHRAFREHVIFQWRLALRRRGRMDTTTIARVDKLAMKWLPKPKVLHL